MNYLSDFHVHPDYSIDAMGSIAEYCARALEIGLNSICFTTHYDTNPQRYNVDGFWKIDGQKVHYSDRLIERYLAEIEDARRYFNPQDLAIYSGLEIDYFPGVEKEVERIKSLFQFDFMIGAVHCIENLAFSEPHEAQIIFHKFTADQMADEYVRLLKMAAESKHFSAIAHLDYYARYLENSPFHGYRIQNEKYTEFFNACRLANIGIEINTSPFKRGISDFHPTKELLQTAIDLGVKISSTGSDSHRPEHLGKGIPESMKFLADRHIEPIFPGNNG